jgi:cell shape-determining protein MreD
MSQLTIKQKNKEIKLFLILFIISIFFSHMGVVGIEDSTIMPNYFIALIVSFILMRKASLNLYKVLIIGLATDLLVGQLIGQYGLIFIIIFILDFLTNKMIVIKNKKQIESLSFILILFGFVILWITANNYNMFIPLKILLLQFILTFIAYLFFKVIITKYTSK